ncbi:MAG: hypothetical protein ABIT37_19125 [Luteolibacter sp.]
MADKPNHPSKGNAQADEDLLIRLQEIVSNAEANLATIVGLVELAKTATATTTESQAAIATIVSEAQTRMADIANISTQSAASMTQIASEQAIIATKSDHIQKAQEHADSVRANLDRTLTEVTQRATESKGSNPGHNPRQIQQQHYSQKSARRRDPSTQKLPQSQNTKKALRNQLQQQKGWPIRPPQWKKI